MQRWPFLRFACLLVVISCVLISRVSAQSTSASPSTTTSTSDESRSTSSAPVTLTPTGTPAVNASVSHNASVAGTPTPNNNNNNNNNNNPPPARPTSSGPPLSAPIPDDTIGKNGHLRLSAANRSTQTSHGPIFAALVAAATALFA